MSDETSPARDEMIALETAYWEAMKAKDGRRTAELSGENALVTGARGVGTIPKDKMGQMTEESAWTLNSYTFEKVEVVAPAPNVAIVAYTVRQNVTMDGQTKDLHAADSSTWVKGPSGWECHGHSETFLEE